MNKVALFLKTYPKDFEWARYCLRSAQKFVRGYDTRMVVCERDHWAGDLAHAHGFSYMPCCSITPGGTGYNHQQVIKLTAFDYLPSCVTHIVFVDSDCVFLRPNTPADLFIDGRPMLPITPFSSLHTPWKAPTERLLGWKCEFETMRRHPEIYRVEDLHRLVAHLDAKHREWRHNFQTLPRNGLSEFNLMGNWVLKHAAEHYHVIDTRKEKLPEPVLKQFWSHHSARSSAHEIERILA